MNIRYSDQAWTAIQATKKYGVQALTLEGIQSELKKSNSRSGVVKAQVSFTVDENRFVVSFTALANGTEMHITQLSWRMR